MKKDATQIKDANARAEFEQDTGISWFMACVMSFESKNGCDLNEHNSELLADAFSFGLTIKAASKLLRELGLMNFLGAIANFVESAVEAIVEPDPAQRAYEALHDPAGFEVITA